jgi:hypothetical protein
MSEAEVKEKLREATEELRELQSSMRKARIVRNVGTLVALVLAITYALLFIGLVKRVFKDQPALNAAIQKEWGHPATRATVQDACKVVLQEVGPLYADAFWKKADELKIVPELSKQLMGFADTAAVMLGPAALNEVAKQNMQSELLKELEELLTDVGSEYYHAFWQLVWEGGLDTASRAAIVDIVNAVGPAYQKEFHRVAPAIMEELKIQQALFRLDAMTVVESRLKAALESALAQKKIEIEQKTGLTEEAVQKKLGQIVMAADLAVRSIVQKRVSSIQNDLLEIDALLDQIPEASQKNEDALLEEISMVSINLIKLSLPETKVQYERQGGAR